MCVSVFGGSADGQIHNAATKTEQRGAADVNRLPINSASIAGGQYLPSVCERAGTRGGVSDRFNCVTGALGIFRMTPRTGRRFQVTRTRR